MTASDAFAEYINKLKALIETYDFTRPGRDQSLGRDAANKVAELILDRSVRDQGGPDGTWPANKDTYTRRKERLYHVNLIGFRTGQMISLPSLLGHVDIGRHNVTLTYGTGTAPSSSMSSPYISESDKQISDTKKAEYFTARKGRFYALDETISDALRELFAEDLDKFIKQCNARR